MGGGFKRGDSGSCVRRGGLLEARGRCFGFGFGFGSALPERSPRISASLSSSWSRAVSGAAAILDERADGRE